MLQCDRMVLKWCMVVCHGQVSRVACLCEEAQIGQPQLCHQLRTIPASGFAGGSAVMGVQGECPDEEQTGSGKEHEEG
jgi:hypothetical protein